MKIEPLTKPSLMGLRRALSPTAAMIARLGDVDLSRGRGILEGNDRCMWTKDRRRITVSLAADGGLIVACGKEEDPECPK